jgi:hypothetical protein
MVNSVPVIMGSRASRVRGTWTKELQDRSLRQFFTQNFVKFPIIEFEDQKLGDIPAP